MIRIYLDSNALFGDRFLTKRPSKDFLEVLEPGKVEARISPVVRAEIARQAVNDAAADVQKLAAMIASLERRWGVDATRLTKNACSLAAEVERLAEASLVPLLEHPAVKEMEWPERALREVVERELADRRPVQLKAGQSTGLRDLAIWYGLLDDLGDDDGDPVLLVTSDTAFLDGEALHADLEGDLSEQGFDPNRFFVRKDLGSATVEVRRLLKLLSDRQAAALQEVRDYLDNLDDDRDEFVWADGISSLRLLEEPSIAAVDVESMELMGSYAEYVEVHAVAHVAINGYVRSEEYELGSASPFELHGGSLDDPYLWVGRDIQVSVVARVIVDLDGNDAYIDELDFEELTAT